MNEGGTIAFYTLGCKLNYTETSTIARAFREAGYREVDFESSPDVIVINTCSVTDTANSKCRNIVNRARRKSPAAFVAVTGCYAQLKPEEIADIPGVNLVLGAAEKQNMLHYVKRHRSKNEQRIYSCEIDRVNAFQPSYSQEGRTRSFLKVQDGCDYSCTFCTIPLARGKSRSQTIAATVRSAENLASRGVKEIVLTGVNIGDFGKSRGEDGAINNETFLMLIEELDKLTGVERFRISSIEPNLLSNDIIEFVAASKRFMPHFHIPLQSGSDRILRLMRRRYKRELYRERVLTIKALMPHCAIGADVITGFPGETDEDFRDTCDFISELPISYLHVFTYSEREHTPAAVMDGPVAPAKRKERSKKLHVLSEIKRTAFYRQFEGAPARVLYESKNADGTVNGFTENYIKVVSEHDEGLEGSLREVQLLSVNSIGLMTASVMSCSDHQTLTI